LHSGTWGHVFFRSFQLVLLPLEVTFKLHHLSVFFLLASLFLSFLTFLFFLLSFFTFFFLVAIVITIVRVVVLPLDRALDAVLGRNEGRDLVVLDGIREGR
jgi:hypothetical protein